MEWSKLIISVGVLVSALVNLAAAAPPLEVNTPKLIRVVTFDYPPYTVAADSQGAVEKCISAAMSELKVGVRFEYYPVARAIKVFEDNSDVYFAGLISQLPVRLRPRVDALNTISVNEYVLGRSGADELGTQDYRGKRFIVLNQDEDSRASVEHLGGLVIPAMTNELAASMVSSKRGEFLLCLDIECAFLARKYGLERSREPHKSTVLQLVFQKKNQLAATLQQLLNKGSICPSRETPNKSAPVRL